MVTTTYNSNRKPCLISVLLSKHQYLPVVVAAAAAASASEASIIVVDSDKSKRATTMAKLKTDAPLFISFFKGLHLLNSNFATPLLLLLLLLLFRLALEILVAFGSDCCFVVLASLTSGGFVIGFNVGVVVIVDGGIDFVVDELVASSIRLVIGSRVEL